MIRDCGKLQFGDRASSVQHEDEKRSLDDARTYIVIPSRLYRSVLDKNALGRVILFPRKILFRTNKYFLVNIVVLDKIKKRCY